MTKKRILILLLIVILILGAIFRLTVLGWLSIVGVVTVVFFGGIHLLVHYRLIRNCEALKPLDWVWILISHSLFISLFLFQGDFDDATEYVVLENITGKFDSFNLSQFNWTIFFIVLILYLLLTAFLVFRLKRIDRNLLRFPPTKKKGSPRKSKIRKTTVQIVIFLILILAVEGVLQWKGYQPGTLDPSFSLLDTITYQPRFYSDSNGVNSFVIDSETLPEGYHINAQGFRSEFNFDKATVDSLAKRDSKKTVMIVGDSYVEGCCADPVANSFVDLLGEDTNLIVLNFGIGSADLMQYKLVVEEYAPRLKPDLIIVAFYLGNDIAYQRRPVTAGVPLVFPIKDYRWLSSVPPPYLGTSETPYLGSPEQAYNFFVEHFTLLGKDRNLFEKRCAHSVICTQIYLGLQHKIKQYSWGYAVDVVKQRYQITNELLHEIDRICSANNTNLVIAAIPPPKDVIKNVDISQRYGMYFEGLKWYYPNVQDFTKADYDGLQTDNHFNNSGHEKYHEFLEEIINQKFKR